MATQRLDGLRVAILATDGVEQVELVKPREALAAEGAQVELVSPKEGAIQGVDHDKPADKIRVDLPLTAANPEDFDALFLPGGVANPDRLRIVPAAVQFVKAFGAADKPIAAICHGPWMLVEAGLVGGKRLTSWPSLQTDIRNAGGQWTDQQVVVDQGLTTSRKPDDIPAFNEAMIGQFAQARQSSGAAEGAPAGEGVAL